MRVFVCLCGRIGKRAIAIVRVLIAYHRPTARIMIVLSKLCFVLSASPQLSARRSSCSSVTLRNTATSFSRLAAAAMSTSTEGQQGWPSVEAFNALSQSTRTKVYSDYGDQGKITWMPHEEPPKVGMSCFVIGGSRGTGLKSPPTPRRPSLFGGRTCSSSTSIACLCQV